MENLQKIFILSLRFSEKESKWLILSVLQFLSLFFCVATIKFLPPASVQFWVLGVGSVAFFGFFTPILWNRINNKFKKAKKIPEIMFQPRVFWSFFCVGLIYFSITLVLKFMAIGWVFSVIILSLLAVFFVAWFLFIGVFGVSAGRAFALCFELWDKKNLVMFGFWLLIVLANTLAFVAAKRAYIEIPINGGFSETQGFATIALLVLLSLSLLAYMLRWLNTFLVLGFLEICGDVDSGDRQETKISQAPSLG